MSFQFHEQIAISASVIIDGELTWSTDAVNGPEDRCGKPYKIQRVIISPAAFPDSPWFLVHEPLGNFIMTYLIQALDDFDCYEVIKEQICWPFDDDELTDFAINNGEVEVTEDGKVVYAFDGKYKQLPDGAVSISI